VRSQVPGRSVAPSVSIGESKHDRWSPSEVTDSGRYLEYVSQCYQLRATVRKLTHRRNIQMLKRKAKELTSVRTSLVDAIFAS
jgi:hypothetical protein